MDNFLKEVSLMNMDTYFDNDQIKVYFSLEYVDELGKHLIVDRKLLLKENLCKEYFKEFLNNTNYKYTILTIVVMDFENIDSELMEEEYDEYLQNNAEDEAVMDFDSFVKKYNEDNAYCELLRVSKRVKI